MQRFRNITIHCENEDAAMQMLQAIMSACNQPPFVYEKDDDRLLKDKTIRIISTHAYTTEAVIIVIASGSDVKVINIIPHKRSVFRIDKNEYNTIMEYFKKEVVNKVATSNLISFPPAEYTMESLIPKSCQHLERWASCPGAPNAPFSHPNDLNLWFDFVTALMINHERKGLSSDDLEQWLEEKKWDEEVIEETILHYEHDTDLLEHYNKVLLYSASINTVKLLPSPTTEIKGKSLRRQGRVFKYDEAGLHEVIIDPFTIEFLHNTDTEKEGKKK